MDSSNTPKPRCQIIKAPSRPHITGHPVIFLAGNTSGATADWRADVIRSLSHLPVTLIDPLRADWDATWREDPAFAPFAEQVRWELDMQARADVVVVHLGAASQAPISLLELGMRAGSGRPCRVVCEEGYWKRGNVLLVGERSGIKVSGSVGELVRAMLDGELKDIGVI